MRLTREILMLEPNHKRANENLAYFEYVMSNEVNKRGEKATMDEITAAKKQAQTFTEEQDEKYELDLDPRNLPWEVERGRYEKLCREPLPVADWRKIHFKCFYTNGGRHPRLVLKPIQTEVLYIRPTVLLYRNILSDTETNLLKNLATPKVCQLVHWLQCYL
jgi:prolyl 4-hydroxylase